MFTHIIGANAPHAYNEALWRLRPQSVTEDSRNGPVRRFPGPVLLEIINPKQRVLFDPIRNANPFFHIMEAVWMLAGDNRVEFLLNYNRRMDTWAEQGILLGAYGYRWRRQFGIDQIAALITQLNKEPGTRQAVIQMWDVVFDTPIAHSLDRPCNTQIYFEARSGYLDMFVMNRSNDLIWGMLGANVVHMTVLQEVVATLTNMVVGKYFVFSKNVHVYENMPNFEKIYNSTALYERYGDDIHPFPIVGDENYDDLVRGCEKFVQEPGLTGVVWLDDVVLPMHRAYMSYKAGTKPDTDAIRASDWQLACVQWLQRRRDEKDKRNTNGRGS